jgi:hypothetical protein
MRKKLTIPQLFGTDLKLKLSSYLDDGFYVEESKAFENLRRYYGEQVTFYFRFAVHLQYWCTLLAVVVNFFTSLLPITRSFYPFFVFYTPN